MLKSNVADPPGWIASKLVVSPTGAAATSTTDVGKIATEFAGPASVSVMPAALPVGSKVTTDTSPGPKPGSTLFTAPILKATSALA